MPQFSSTRVFDDHGRSELVRLDTLALLRWCAVFGQTLTVIFGTLVLDLDLPLLWICLTIGALVAANIGFHVSYPSSQTGGRLVAMFFMFDLVQLAVLIGLTGGLSNPFAMLLLAPATLGASVLPARWAGSAVVVALIAVAMIGAFSYPLMTNDGAHIEAPGLLRLGYWAALSLAIVFIGFFSRQIWLEIQTISDALVAMREALAREQKLADLSGIVAATAHELGTPLATIKLVSKELSSSLAEGTELKEDADLIYAQANRCRDIMQQMGHSTHDDHMRAPFPIQAIVEEAARPHAQRTDFNVTVMDAHSARPQPVLPRLPEILHGLRNLIQNSADHAKSKVQVEISWGDDHLNVVVRDDGPGFPPHLIGRLGDPLLRRRRAGGSGLGLFISKTLLERTGASLAFSNASEGGAVAKVTWSQGAMERLLEGEAT